MGINMEIRLQGGHTSNRTSNVSMGINMEIRLQGGHTSNRTSNVSIVTLPDLNMSTAATAFHLGGTTWGPRENARVMSGKRR
jgi:hypothetical protein